MPAKKFNQTKRLCDIESTFGYAQGKAHTYLMNLERSASAWTVLVPSLRSAARRAIVVSIGGDEESDCQSLSVCGWQVYEVRPCTQLFLDNE